MPMELSIKTNKDHNDGYRQIFLVFLFGFIIRFFAFNYTFIINPDGILYIHQARAIYYGELDSIFSCMLTYLSNYSIFITGAYYFINDWLISAKSVSLFFGSALLVFIYLLFRQFFDKDVSLLGTLIYALIPNHVDKSADVLRDPVFWFFLAGGLYFYILQFNKKNLLFLLLSSVFFLCAAWARIEGILFIFIACFFIIAVHKEEKILRLIIFLSPLIILTISVLLNILPFDIPVDKFFRVREILPKFSVFMNGYIQLRSTLDNLIVKQSNHLLGFFLSEVKTCIWLVALGTLINRILEAFFYPYFIFVLIGLGGIFKRFKNDSRIIFLSLTVSFATLTLYVHTLENWTLHNRFIAIVIFPSFIFFGFGIEKLIGFLQAKLKFKKSSAMAWVCFLIMVAGLPKNLQIREGDKKVFTQIGNYLSKREGNGDVIKIVGVSSPVLRWVSFYANKDYHGAYCPRIFLSLEKNWKQLYRSLDEKEINYLLIEENNWPKGDFDLGNNYFIKHFDQLGPWYHRDTGRIFLFKKKDDLQIS
jgi:hypothetical protein